MTRQEGAAAVAAGVRAAGAPLAETVLGALLEAGQRMRAHDATRRALVAYWKWLRVAARVEREALLVRLRDAVAAGRSGPDAWVAAILGEHDFGLVRDAAREFLGLRPMSLERHEAAAASARDWVRRALPLNRAAVFAALLERADDDALGQLRGLRSALGAAEGAAVIANCRGGGCSDGLQAFLEDWGAMLD